MGQKIVLVVRQIMPIEREGQIFKFNKPRDAVFCTFKAALDVLLNYSPVNDLRLIFTEHS